MAEEFLEGIYREAYLAYRLKKAVEYARIHDEFHMIAICNDVFLPLCEICKEYLQEDKEKGIALWQSIQSLVKIDNDLVRRGDVIEEKILPLLKEKIRRGGGDISVENEEGDYLFESSDSGFLTLVDLKRNKYIHSACDPMWEAAKLAEYIFNPEKKEYCIWGIGLGYLIYQLYILSEGTVRIHVFEKDARMVEYAKRYGVLCWVPEDVLDIVHDESTESFLQCMAKKDMGYYVFLPEIYREEADAQRKLEDAYMEFATPKKMQAENELNYWRNHRSGCRAVKDFDTKSMKKDFIIVAAGPSLDDSLDFLKENQGKKTVIAVCTVFRKLLEQGIRPDMVVILDPMAIVYRQLEGLEGENVPMLVAATAYWKFAANYQGDKYLVPLTGVHEERESDEPWAIGGTVTHLAIEAAVRFGAENIFLVGVDLAFPNNLSHAEGTVDRTIVNTEGMLPVQGVGEDFVYADSKFIAYRKWIEARIALTPRITYYNLSRVGAKIAGAKEIHFEERQWENGESDNCTDIDRQG